MAQRHVNHQHGIENERARVRVSRRCWIVIYLNKYLNLSQGRMGSFLSRRFCAKLISYLLIHVQQDSKFSYCDLCNMLYNNYQNSQQLSKSWLLNNSFQHIISIYPSRSWNHLFLLVVLVLRKSMPIVQSRLLWK